jgi:hypothetical protein
LYSRTGPPSALAATGLASHSSEEHPEDSVRPHCNDPLFAPAKDEFGSIARKTPFAMSKSLPRSHTTTPDASRNNREQAIALHQK